MALSGQEHDLTLDDITGLIVGTAYRIHGRVGCSLLESLYVSILAYELRKKGLETEREKPVTVCYDGDIIEDAFRADLIVQGRVIVEVKSVERMAPVHKAHLLTYLRLMDLRVGLLLNFAAETMKEGVKRIVNNYNPGASPFLRIDRPQRNEE